MKNGIFNDMVHTEFSPPGSTMTFDIAIIPKEQKQSEKGIVIEINGPSHYFVPATDVLNPFSRVRHQLIESMGYKVYSFPTYFFKNQDLGEETNETLQNTLSEIIESTKLMQK